MKAKGRCRNVQETLEGRLQEAGIEMQTLNQDLKTAKSLVSALEVSLQRANSMFQSVEQEAIQLRRQLEEAERAVASAESRAQQAKHEGQLARRKAQAQQSASSAAVAELEASLARMVSTAAAKRDEIASVHATVQACCSQHLAHHQLPCVLHASCCTASDLSPCSLTDCSTALKGGGPHVKPKNGCSHACLS
jgi:chromosome segregation ATPase